MINPITQILMIRRAEMNLQLQDLEKSWRKGNISFDEYNERSKMLIKERYKEEARVSDVDKDNEPTGLLGIALRVIRKIFH